MDIASAEDQNSKARAQATGLLGEAKPVKGRSPEPVQGRQYEGVPVVEGSQGTIKGRP